HIREADMEPGGEVEAEAERLAQDGDPVGGDRAAAVGHADDKAARALLPRLGERYVGKAEVGLTAFHPELADRRFGTPVADAVGVLGRERVGRIAQEQEVGWLDHRRAPAGSDGPQPKREEVRLSRRGPRPPRWPPASGSEIAGG